MKFALGTVQFGLDYGVANECGRVSKQEAGRILQRAKACGITTLDTAIAYGDSELVLGQLGIDKWKTITKLPPVPKDCDDVSQWVNREIRKSMQRLRVSQLHGVLLHQPAQLLDYGGATIYKALQNLKNQGLSQKIGVSVYSPAELDLLVEKFPTDIVQAPLNIFDRRLVESNWASRLHDYGVEIHTRSTFLQGLLLLPPNRRPEKFDRWAAVWNVWDRWLASEGITPLQACVRYVTKLVDIDYVLVGVDSANQLNEILEAAEGDLNGLPELDCLRDARLLNPYSWNSL